MRTPAIFWLSAVLVGCSDVSKVASVYDAKGQPSHVSSHREIADPRLSEGADVFAYDSLITYEGGALVVEFSDGRILRLGADTVLQLAAPGSPVVGSLIVGEATVVSPSSIRIRTLEGAAEVSSKSVVRQRKKGLEVLSGEIKMLRTGLSRPSKPAVKEDKPRFEVVVGAVVINPGKGVFAQTPGGKRVLISGQTNHSLPVSFTTEAGGQVTLKLPDGVEFDVKEKSVVILDPDKKAPRGYVAQLDMGAAEIDVEPETEPFHVEILNKRIVLLPDETGARAKLSSNGNIERKVGVVTIDGQVLEELRDESSPVSTPNPQVFQLKSDVTLSEVLNITIFVPNFPRRIGFDPGPDRVEVSKSAKFRRPTGAKSRPVVLPVASRSTLYYRFLGASGSSRGRAIVKVGRPSPPAKADEYRVVVDVTKQEGTSTKITYPVVLTSVTFKWPSIERATEYRFRLFSSEGKRIIEKTTPGPSQFVNGSLLLPGEYFWSAIPVDSQGAKLSSPKNYILTVASNVRADDLRAEFTQGVNGGVLRGAAPLGARLAVNGKSVQIAPSGRFEHIVQRRQAVLRYQRGEDSRIYFMEMKP